jgi:poly(3-hydroxybutyrate) depolymerase
MLRAFAAWSSVAGLALCASCSSSAPSDEPTSGAPNAGGASAAGAAAGTPGTVGGNASVSGGNAGGPSSGAAGSGVASSGAAGSGVASSGAAGSGAAGAGGALVGPNDAASRTAIEQLEAWLALATASRPVLAEQAFAKVALTKADSARARQLLVSDYTAQLKASRASEVGATETSEKTLKVGNVSMKYYRAQRGTKPAAGWSLFISMHGGGNAEAATNDSQWENQIALVDGYEPKDAIWVAPRAPTNEWNMWFREHLDGLFERLIANLVAFDGVDPNHVYLNGYSAGGDGAYQMGPRMADAWAGVGMSAGHPNDASPLSLRNTAFAIHVGGSDTAYDRNLKAAEWGAKLDSLAAADAGGYEHQWQVHAGKPHWMELADKVSIPFMQAHARDPIPKKVVWRQSGTLRARFYWLAVDPADVAAGSEITASYSAQTIELAAATKVKRITLRVSDAMLDQDRPVSVKRGGAELFSGVVPRTIAVLYSTLVDRGDPSLVFTGELSVKLE